MSLFKENIKDPTAWVAFVGFVLGGVQTLIGSANTGLSADRMGNLMLLLGILGLVVRGVETYFVRRNAAMEAAVAELEAEDKKPGG